MQPSFDAPLYGDDLLAEVRAFATSCGTHDGNWPGLQLYRYSSRSKVPCEHAKWPGLFVVVQGTAQVVLDGERMACPPFCYLVLPAGSTALIRVGVTCPTAPFLALYVPLDPGLIRRLSDILIDCDRADLAQSGHQRDPVGFEPSLLDSLRRFLRATTCLSGRRVLAPVYMHELLYGLFLEGQTERLLTSAAQRAHRNIISETRNFVRDRIAEPLSVADLAAHMSMSQSAFAHHFRKLAGLSPYQFVKEIRLDRARELLIEGDRRIGEIARDVGYGSLSHFSNDFKRHFGVPPRVYTETLQRLAVTASAGSAQSS